MDAGNGESVDFELSQALGRKRRSSCSSRTCWPSGRRFWIGEWRQPFLKPRFFQLPLSDYRSKARRRRVRQSALAGQKMLARGKASRTKRKNAGSWEPPPGNPFYSAPAQKVYSVNILRRKSGSYKWMFRSSGLSVLETGMSALNSLWMRPRVSRATSPSGLELHDGAILANHGSLNVDDSAERRVRNGCHKEALGGSARRGDRDGL